MSVISEVLGQKVNKVRALRFSYRVIRRNIDDDKKMCRVITVVKIIQATTFECG